MNNFQEQIDSSLVSLFNTDKNSYCYPTNYSEFKAAYIPIYYTYCNNINHNDPIERKLSFFESFQELYLEPQPIHIVEYLCKISQSLKPKPGLKPNEIPHQYDEYLKSCYKMIKSTIDKKFYKKFHQNFNKNFDISNFNHQNPLFYFFQEYYSTYGESYKYLTFLKKYLLERYLDNDIPFDSFVNLYNNFIESKKQLLSVYHNLLNEILIQFINPTEMWPTVTKLSDLDLKVIRKLVDKKLTDLSPELISLLPNGDLLEAINSKEFKDEIELVFTELCQERFNDSFMELYPVELRNNFGQITKNGCLSLYISLFQENDSYIMYLPLFLDKYAMDFKLDSTDRIIEIASSLNELREEISIKAHMNNIENKLYSNTYAFSRNYTITDIDELSGLDFEQFLEKLFTKMGYSAQVTKSTGDQGADLVLSKLGRKIAVQAKRYNNKLDNTPIQEILGAKAYYKCTETMVVTNSYFTKKAIDLAQVNNVQLIDRDDLIELLETYPIVKKD